MPLHLREFVANALSHIGNPALGQNLPSALCQHAGRKRHYQKFLQQPIKTPQTLISFGQKLMWYYGLHPHFFGNNSLLDNARHLTFYGLGLPRWHPDPGLLDRGLSEQEVLAVFILFERRIAERIPVEYLTQEAEYLGNYFYVNEQVLVPRSLMSTRFTDFISAFPWSTGRVLDLCTGSGCIGLSLALLDSRIQVDLADLSFEALKVAARNIHRHGLEERARCIQGNLFENIHGRYDLIISNPPYVASAHYRRGPLEFKNEPRMALEAGADGLDVVRRILREAKAYLNPAGKLIMEVGFPAAKRVKREFRKLPLKWYTYRKPNGKRAFLAMDCVLECKASDLLGDSEFVVTPHPDLPPKIRGEGTS